VAVPGDDSPQTRETFDSRLLPGLSPRLLRQMYRLGYLVGLLNLDGMHRSLTHRQFLLRVLPSFAILLQRPIHASCYSFTAG
jgi:hypothetical protein